jgi:hypothetical protein
MVDATASKAELAPFAAHYIALILQRKFGAGEGIRTLAPNLGKAARFRRHMSPPHCCPSRIWDNIVGSGSPRFLFEIRNKPFRLVAAQEPGLWKPLRRVGHRATIYPDIHPPPASVMLPWRFVERSVAALGFLQAIDRCESFGAPCLIKMGTGM